MPAPDEDLTTTAGWNKFIARHLGQASVNLAPGQNKVGEGDAAVYYDAKGNRIPNDQVKWKYELNDGSTVTIDDRGAATEINEVKASVATGTAPPGVDPNAWPNTTWVLDEDSNSPTFGKEVQKGINPRTGGYEPIPGAVRSPAAKAAPDTSYRDTRMFKMPDGSQQLWGTNPATNQFEPVKGAPTVPADAEKPAQAQVLGSAAGGYYSWDGSTLKAILPGKDPDAKEGDRRPNVQGGLQIQEVYRGGNWVPDPLVEPVPWTPAARAEAAKVAGQPKEGDTRPNVNQGYRVQEVYRGGEWVVNPDVPPTRYTPEKITPTTVTTQADQPFVARTDETGQLTWAPNQNYQPKTIAQVQARIGQLQQAATQKADELRKKISPQYSPEQAHQDFQTWYDQNVGSQTQSLQAAAEEVAFQRAKDEADMRRQAYTAAATAGTTAVSAYGQQGAREASTTPETQAAYAAIQRGEMPNLAGAFTVKQPDLQKTAEEATMRALSSISPYAAAQAGAPPPNLQGTDVTAALAPSQYQFGATPPAGLAAPAGAAPWQRADQANGMTPAGNALAPGPGLTGTLGPDDPRWAAIRGTPPAGYPPNQGAFSGAMPVNPNVDYQELLRRAMSQYQFAG